MLCVALWDFLLFHDFVPRPLKQGQPQLSPPSTPEIRFSYLFIFKRSLGKNCRNRERAFLNVRNFEWPPHESNIFRLSNA